MNHKAHKDHKEKKMMLFKTQSTTQIISHGFTRLNTDFFVVFLTRNPKPKTVIHTKPGTRNPKPLRASAAPCGKKGFTLIELIVSILIFGILSALLFSTFIQIQRNISKNRWKSQLTEESVKICDIIRIELTGAREIHYADQDSISFINQEGKLSSFCWKNYLLYKSNRNIVPTDIKVISFRFIYYLPSDIINESSEPIYFLPVEPKSLKRLKVVDWEIGIKKGKTTINLKTGVFIRSIR